ncbi:MAG: 50S ribosomal protein L11 methyltransferase, partial [Acidobacteriota bacterium]
MDPGDGGRALTDLGIDAEGRVALHVPAENAFGTGSHESTRLMLLWMSELDLTGLDVLDVGCGSGILSFAAERLGAKVVGFDLDVPSAITARRNGIRNGCRP